MLKLSISALAAFALIAGIFLFVGGDNSKTIERQEVLISIAELGQRESEITREMYLLKFGETLNFMSLHKSEQRFRESESILKSQLDEEFEKVVVELNRLSRHRKNYISQFKSSWAVHRNSRSSILRIPSLVIEQSDAAFHAELLSQFHKIERDFLIEADVERNLRLLPKRLSELEALVSQHANAEGERYFEHYQRHLKLYLESRAEILDSITKTELYSVRPILEKIRVDIFKSRV